MKKYILALDQGTTGTTVAIYDSRAFCLGSVNKEHPQIYPQPGWVEHDPERIWQSVVEGVRDVLARTKVKGEQIACVGITNQRETVVLWDRRDSRPLYNAIVWQCRRTTEFCQRLKKEKREPLIRRKTGLVLDPYFSASKIRWLLDHVPSARKSAAHLAAGTIDSFLLWRMTGGAVHKTDVSNAARTQLMNIHSGDWDSDLFKLFKVPRSLMPEICPSNSEFGLTHGFAGLPDGIPITGIAGDQQSALFGQACFATGAAKCTFGTGSFLLMNTGSRPVASRAGLLTTVAWQLVGDRKLTYALEGGAFICGAAVQWLRDELQFLHKSADIEGLAKKVESTEGVYLVPAFVGLGAPYWDPEARAALVGMTRGTNRSHIARATLEAMALQNVDILVAMEKDLRRKMKSVRVDGGAVANDLLMQMQADYLGVPVERPAQIESTVLGAAFLAGLGAGVWSSQDEIAKVWKLSREFQPVLGAEARKIKRSEWARAVARVRSR